MNTPEFDFWKELGCLSVALFYGKQNATLTERAGRVLSESWKNRKPFLVERGLPSGFADEPKIRGDRGKSVGVWVDQTGMVCADFAKLERLEKEFADDTIKSGYLERVQRDAGLPRDVYPARYWHSGTHKVADIEFLLKYGYEGYLEQIESERQKCKKEDVRKLSFLKGMELTARTLMKYALRCASIYRRIGKRNGDIKMEELGVLLEHVPQKPCRTFREAIVVVRFLNLICDSEFGRIDQYLYPYYRNDLETGRLTREQAKEMLADLCYFVDREGLVWHQVIGGCDRKGRSAYNELTEIILENAPRFAHPHISLRVREDMPEQIWKKAFNAIKTGCGNPALVQESVYIRDLTESYGVCIEDAREFAFGGCSETLIPGKTNVDSTWCAYNVLEVLMETLFRYLEGTENFAEFCKIFREEVQLTVEEMTEHINIRQHVKAAFCPEPLVTLHMEGCLKKGLTFWEGGTEYNFDGADIFGNTNVVNSLVTIKALYEGKLGVDRTAFLDALKTDFASNPNLLRKIEKLPKFGNGDMQTAEIAKEHTDFCFPVFAKNIHGGLTAGLFRILFSG